MTASWATSARASTGATCWSAAPSRRRSSTGDSGSAQRFFTDVDNSMTIAQEEIFGPVLVVTPYDDGTTRSDRQRQRLRPGRQCDVGFAGALTGGSARLRAGFIGLNGTAGWHDTPRSAATRPKRPGARTASRFSSVHRGQIGRLSSPVRISTMEQLFDDLDDFPGRSTTQCPATSRPHRTGRLRREEPVQAWTWECRTAKPTGVHRHRFEEAQQLLKGQRHLRPPA